MPRRLRSYVHVRDDKHVTHVFGPDDEIPAWAAEQITNPKAWAPHPDDDQRQSAGNGNGAAAGTEQPATGGRPPKVGTGSSREDWAAYAAAHDIEMPGNATKAEIIAAVEAAEQ